MPTSQPVLVAVDDDELQGFTLKALLHPHGQVELFADPREAIAFLTDHPADAVVTDLDMPYLPVDGFWLVERLRDEHPEIAIVVRSARSAPIFPEGRGPPPFRVFVKARNSNEEFEAGVEEAIAETARRRA